MRGAQFSDLQSRVIAKGLCRYCGACALICPVDVIVIGNVGPSLAGRCVSCGLCLRVCPVLTMLPELPIQEGFLARPSSKVPGSKTCGLVTEVSCALLEEGKVDAVLVSKLDAGFRESSYLARSTEEIREAAGANYFSRGHLLFMKEAIKRDERVAVIGTGCCIEATRLITSISGRHSALLPYKLGLFCSSQLDSAVMSKILLRNGIDPSAVRSINIRSRTASIASSLGHSSRLTLAEISTAKRSSCSHCYDLDNWAADISFGEMGAPPGYVIVLIRSRSGREIIELSERRFERIPIPPEVFEEFSKVKSRKHVEADSLEKQHLN